MAAQKKSLLTRQPGKTIWVILAIILTIIRLSLWLTYFIPKSFRQYRTRTYCQAVTNELLKEILYHLSVIQPVVLFLLNPGAEKERFTTISPAKDSLYRGVTQDSEVRPAVIGGTWFPSPYRSEDEQEKKVVLHFHGGAYVMGDGRQRESGYGAGLLIKHMCATVFSVQYRLSSDQKCPFPAALQDAYRYLLDQGISPLSIVLSGDSSGGNLVIALLRYLSDNKGLLPNPSAALLWSPSVDLAAAFRSERHRGQQELQERFPDLLQPFLGRKRRYAVVYGADASIHLTPSPPVRLGNPYLGTGWGQPSSFATTSSSLPKT
ncbi:MAG: hypothetical protein M1837_007244 [Sclerophora amabilis]|nr:MAG: hypothetical protein M1837_007244 [Sclerophora amabilis]